MYLFNYTYPSPEENLAIDEYLLQEVNHQRLNSGICRLWESPSYFVVLGLSKKIKDDVYDTPCQQDNIPIYKRCSGGGTVLQGPGSFNYSYILPIDSNHELSTITSTTSYILNKVSDCLSPVIPNIKLSGISDLTINNIKFSGNAQRRLKHAILFHGTILYNFNIDLVSKYLKEPPDQPKYRKERPHHKFIQNIAITKDQLVDCFSASEPFATLDVSDVTISHKIMEKYRTKSLN